MEYLKAFNLLQGLRTTVVTDRSSRALHSGSIVNEMWLSHEVRNILAARLHPCVKCAGIRTPHYCSRYAVHENRYILQGSHLEELASFLAFKALGSSFKWMFVGEDDTLFFRLGAATAVHGMDPEMPIYISGWLGHANATNLAYIKTTCFVEGPCNEKFMQDYARATMACCHSHADVLWLYDIGIFSNKILIRPLIGVISRFKGRHCITSDLAWYPNFVPDIKPSDEASTSIFLHLSQSLQA